MRTLMRGTAALLAVAVAAYAVIGYSALPVGALVHPAMAAGFASQANAVLVHAFSAALALAAAPLQFSRRLRQKRPRWHRAIGRAYLGIGVLAGGLSGLWLAAHAFGGPVAQAGFGALAVAWLFTGERAWRAIRRGDVAAHRRWMIRNVSLTFAAVTLRLYLPASMAAGIAFEVAYPAVAWLCWVPNLVIGHGIAARSAAAHAAGAAVPGRPAVAAGRTQPSLQDATPARASPRPPRARRSRPSWRA